MLGWDDPLDMWLQTFIRDIDTPLDTEMDERQFDALYPAQERDFFRANKQALLNDKNLSAVQSERFSAFLNDEIRLCNYKHRMETTRWRDIQMVKEALLKMPSFTPAKNRPIQTTSTLSEDDICNAQETFSPKR